ncbi:MAG: dGTPase [Actinomycetota bacterium]|nr:dGTPase [Actinomycetota bacterium]
MPTNRLDRLHLKTPTDNRNNFEIDRDRILYSSALRRLAGVTQVVSAMEGRTFHNRLTHSLKVAQIGQRLAEKLGRDAQRLASESGIELKDGTPSGLHLDSSVVEAAALAHDLGHPPFGHAAEAVLQGRMNDLGFKDSFEGNAQSFRIVTRLSVARLEHPGIDLTRATKNAILKYPWLRDETDPKKSKKWGSYRSEWADFKHARQLMGPGEPELGRAGQSLEAAIMDWADDITYAVHDVEDLYRARLVPLALLASSDEDLDEFAEWVCRRWNAQGDNVDLGGIRFALGVIEETFAPAGPRATARERKVALKSFVSVLVNRYIQNTQIKVTGSSTDKPTWELSIPPEIRLEVKALKELTWRYLIADPSLASQQHGQAAVISALFDIFMESLDRSSPRGRYVILPEWVRDEIEDLDNRGTLSEETRARVVCDAICSLTDEEALRLHARLVGCHVGTIYDAVANF